MIWSIAAIACMIGAGVLCLSTHLREVKKASGWRVLARSMFCVVAGSTLIALALIIGVEQAVINVLTINGIIQ